MARLKPLIVYYEIAIGNVWIEDFVDEDTGSVISIERFNKTKYEYIKTTIMCDRKPNKNLIKEYLDIYVRFTYSNKRFSKLLTEAKYNKLINDTYYDNTHT